jgi:hypothetical protein
MGGAVVRMFYLEMIKQVEGGENGGSGSCC